VYFILPETVELYSCEDSWGRSRYVSMLTSSLMWYSVCCGESDNVLVVGAPNIRIYSANRRWIQLLDEHPKTSSTMRAAVAWDIYRRPSTVDPERQYRLTLQHSRPVHDVVNARIFRPRPYNLDLCIWGQRHIGLIFKQPPLLNYTLCSENDDKHIIKWMWAKKIRRKWLLKMFLTEDKVLMGVCIKTLIKMSVRHL